jgi:hypothetical protein
VRRLALSLSVLLLAALGVPAVASAAATAPANPAAAAPAGNIEAMSCVAAKSCIGVGDYASPVKGASAFLRTWNGAAWGPIYGTLPASADDYLSSISCTSATFCVAVGSRFSGENSAPLVATWNGSSWSQTVPPNPATSIKDTGFSSVSCANARSCVAVGTYYAVPARPTYPNLSEGFIDRWNGAKWTASFKTTAGGKKIQATYLGGVSCRSASNCVAVGSTNEPIFVTNELTDTTDHPVALTWNGKKWAASTVPIPSGQPGVLDGVSCWSVSRCVAVGNYFARPKGAPAAGRITFMSERWNGAKWSLTKMPTSGFDIWLNDVSCVSASSCLAVGVNAGNAEHNFSLADVWNGKTWRSVAVATPKGGSGKTGPYPNSFELTNLTCAAANDCVAFGFAGPLQNFAAVTTFAEHYAGSRLSNIADS